MSQARAADVMLIILTEKNNVQNPFVTAVMQGISVVQTNSNGLTFDHISIVLDRGEEAASLKAFCTAVESNQFAAIVDLTWNGWEEVGAKSKVNGFPYIRLDSTVHHFVKAADNYLLDNEAVDTALIFRTEAELDQTLHYLIGNSNLRVMVVDMEENDVITRLSKLRPSPSYYVAHGSTATVIDIYKKAKSKKLVKRDARWTLVFHDWNYNRFDTSLLGDAKATFFTMGSE